MVFAGAQIGDPATTAATGRATGPVDTWAVDSHGIGTSSVATGNIHGSCPNCVLVYVHGTSEQANQWIAKQSWIDLQSNSWGLSAAGVARDRVYAGSDTQLQRRATERGQPHFFSAGNGLENAFIATNPTLFSSQEGPDWIITVGAIAPNGSSYSGHGKPSDIASIGSAYPSATGGNGTVTGSGGFGGTSNATPVLAGIYGEALYRVRRELAGGSRMQSNGVIAQGQAGCAAANPNCPMKDGKLTVHELTEAFFRSARHTPQGTNVGGVAQLPATENAEELEFLGEGHGSCFGKFKGTETYEEELKRITDYVFGRGFSTITPEQRDWYIADSFCRQQIWGTWDFGEDKLGAMPATDPNWPVRSYYTTTCPQTLPVVVAAEKAYASQFTELDSSGGDRDDDGIADESDNCPDNGNGDQLDADAFSFGRLDGQAPGVKVESPVRTLVNYDKAGVSPGPGVEYRINGGAWRSSKAVMLRGDTLQVRHLSNSSKLGYTKSYIAVGGVRGEFITRTR